MKTYNYARRINSRWCRVFRWVFPSGHFLFPLAKTTETKNLINPIPNPNSDPIPNHRMALLASFLRLSNRR